MENNPSVVLVTEEKRRRRGIVWVACGAAAILAGSSTFALWKAESAIPAGGVTAGSLEIDAVSVPTYWDVSTDRKDSTAGVTNSTGVSLGSLKGHQINDTSTWRAVPGDQVAAIFNVPVTLTGDNLVALLSIPARAPQSAQVGGSPSVSVITYEYAAYLDDALVATGDSESDLKLYLAATGNGQGAGLSDEIIASDPSSESVHELTAESHTITVVITASVSDDLPESSMTAAIPFGGETFTLTQVRDTGAQFSTE
ncbi:hypothetical protein [Xylanimonas ulmi]|uniref:Alternate signal-mediated exported protein n=1 Tax=Xylanimonas ulmi TaxID=228973 RepID=A0A4Q7M3C6_9MICO|nr:hypothetical protein [Xylanibacterium ulmi]RZS62024.1 alternate signal-mediated exported protein [Xylanibacterium ulmi]